MITVRKAKEIYRAEGRIENGTFTGRWHFAFAEYCDPRYERFGTLRVAARRLRFRRVRGCAQAR
jgi:hypothetical protein